jgi:Transposase DDE domain/Domain of unknown function (DUF4372)
MPHQHSVLHALLKGLPWPVFAKLVQDHCADARVRTLSTKAQLIALLFGQLAGAGSLRAIETGVASYQARLSRLGLGPVARSTLADANAKRPFAVFTGLLAHLMAQAAPGLQRRMGEAVRLIDSTCLRLSRLSESWARFSKTVHRAKLHVIYDPDADRPIYTLLTPARVNDITPAKRMPIEPGATYVFDLGYYDFGWWARLDAAGCRFVTRLKSHTAVMGVVEVPRPAGSPIRAERIGHLPERLAKTRRNPFQEPVRELEVQIETGAVLRIVTNDLDAPAEEIADLYKRRWAIELFFKWSKQGLTIKHLLGSSENAVRIQMAVAMIAFLLLRIAHGEHPIVKSPLAFLRLVRFNLMQDRSLDRLIEPKRLTRRARKRTPQLRIA